MNRRADQLASLSLNDLISQVQDSDADLKEAKRSMEAAEIMFKATRAKYLQTSEFQKMMRAFARDLLATRDEKGQEKIRQKYQRRFADYQQAISEAQRDVEKSRGQVAANLDAFKNLIDNAADELGKKMGLTPSTVPDIAAQAVVAKDFGTHGVIYDKNTPEVQDAEVMKPQEEKKS